MLIGMPLQLFALSSLNNSQCVMTKRMEVYKCNVCGNIVEVLHEGVGELVCCNQPMEIQGEKTEAEEGVEKHVPVVEKTENGVKVKVGSTEHPMEDKHYIEWIEVVSGGEVQRKFLNPGERPEAEFCISGEHELVREYCNIHGLWKAD